MEVVQSQHHGLCIILPVLPSFSSVRAAMFAFSVKNPLETETVGQRRERKARESEGSLLSSRAGSSAKFETQKTKSSKRSALGPRPRPASPGNSAHRLPTENRETFPVELPGSPVPLPPIEPSASSPSQSPALPELSTSPSVCRNRTAKAQPVYSPAPARSLRPVVVRSRPVPRTFSSLDAVFQRQPEASPDTAEPLSPAELDPAPKQQPDLCNADRPRVSAQRSISSTSSTSVTRSIPEGIHCLGFTDSQKSHQLPRQQESECVSTPATTVSAPSDPEMERFSPPSPLILAKSEAGPKAVSAARMGPDTVSPRRSGARSSYDGSTAIGHPAEFMAVPPLLNLMQHAPDEIICLRLSENWNISKPDLANLVDFEQNLWGLSGLRRLGNGGTCHNHSLLGGKEVNALFIEDNRGM